VVTDCPIRSFGKTQHFMDLAFPRSNVLCVVGWRSGERIPTTPAQNPCQMYEL
jgi:hypothetical protein